MRARLLKHWPTLWQQFGIRPMDVDRLTLLEVVSVERALDEWSRQKR